MILNQTALNTVPLDSSGGIIGVNPDPVLIASSVSFTEYVLTSITITPDAPSVTSSTNYQLVIAFDFASGGPAVSEGVVQNPALIHYGLDFAAPSPKIIRTQKTISPKFTLGLSLNSTPAVSEVVAQTGILRITFEQQAAAPAHSDVVTQFPTGVNFGLKMATTPAVAAVMLQTSPYLSVATGYITLSGSVFVTATLNPGQMLLSNIVINADPIEVEVVLPEPAVILGSVVVSGLSVNAYSTVGVKEIRFSSIHVTPKMPIVHTSLAYAAGGGVVITSPPPPVVVVPKALPIIRASINASTLEVLQGDIVLPFYGSSSPQVNVSIAGQAQIIGGAKITPSSVYMYTDVYMGSKYQPVTVSPSVQVTASVSGAFRIAPLVISGGSPQATTSVTVQNAFLGSVVLTNLGVEANTSIFEPVIQLSGATATPDPVEITSSVGFSQVVYSTIKINLLGSPVGGITAVDSPEVVFTTVSITPDPVEISASTGYQRVTQPDLVINADPVEISASASLVGDAMLSSVVITPGAPTITATAQGQFKFGLTGALSSQGIGGIVTDTDWRGQLNVDPLNRPGQLDSLTQQT